MCIKIIFLKMIIISYICACKIIHMHKIKKEVLCTDNNM